jgi:hypothetical protein
MRLTIPVLTGVGDEVLGKETSSFMRFTQLTCFLISTCAVSFRTERSFETKGKDISPVKRFVFFAVTSSLLSGQTLSMVISSRLSEMSASKYGA